jgi:ketosteroid isomerase-like protein
MQAMRRIGSVILCLGVLALGGCGGVVPSGSDGTGPPGSPTGTTSPASDASSHAPSPAASPSDSATSNASATSHPRMSASELTAFDAAARELAAAMDANVADAHKEFAQFTDDAWLADPTNGQFSIAPKSDIVSAWANWMSGWPDYSSKTVKTFVSADAAAFETQATGLTGFMPPDGVVDELRVMRFSEDGRVRMFELWYDVADMLEAPCLPQRDCPAAAKAFTDAYSAAWSSHDAARIAGLYRTDATLADSALGVSANGPAAIAGLADGPATSGLRCVLRRSYLQTNDGDPSSSDNTDPLGGRVVGVGMVQGCETATGKAVDRLSVVLFGTRQPTSFELDPNQLIVTEETFYDAAELVLAGLVD